MIVFVCGEIKAQPYVCVFVSDGGGNGVVNMVKKRKEPFFPRIDEPQVRATVRIFFFLLFYSQH